MVSDGERGAAKLIPEHEGAGRELLFVDLGGVRNVDWEALRQLV